MTSLISKEEFKEKLIEFIKSQNIDELNNLKKIISNKENCTGDYPSSPGKPSLENISSTGEKAFQRAIINGKYSLLKPGKNKDADKITWLDLELPVTLNKNPRRPSIDLIGSEDDGTVARAEEITVGVSTNPDIEKDEEDDLSVTIDGT